MTPSTNYRAGNIVQAKAPNQTVYRKNVVLTKDKFRMLLNDPPRINVQPMKLTDDFFLDYGFADDMAHKGDSIVSQWKKGNLTIDVVDGEFYFDTTGGRIKIEHIHHLQNLFHVVNLKELK